MVKFVIGKADPVEATKTTWGVVTPVLFMVMFRVVPPEFDPSRIVLGLKICTSAPLASVPEIVGETPEAGFIVTVLVTLDPGLVFKTSGKVSDAPYDASVNTSVTGQVITLLFRSAKAAVSVVYVCPTPTLKVPQRLPTIV